VTIDELEEVTFKSWPSFEERRIHGWVARYAGGYTRRVNAASFLHTTTTAPTVIIEKCESWFRERGETPTFRIVARPETQGVERELEARGYRRELESVAMVADGNSELLSQAVGMEEVSIPKWIELSTEFSGESENENGAQRRLLESISTAKVCGVVGGACGVSVVVDSSCGFFGIVTNPEMRRQGYGELIMRALARWGRDHGATCFYLQVRANNEPARKLYEKLGFRDAYTYSFRVPGRGTRRVDE
jgi:RimJ/RimL family protein N-acetyltransferase